MNSSEVQSSWPECRIKNWESIERSHACILNGDYFAFRTFIPISEQARFYRAGWVVKFSPRSVFTAQCVHRTDDDGVNEKKKEIYIPCIRDAREISPATRILRDVAKPLAIIYGETPVMDEQDASIRRRQRRIGKAITSLF